MARVPAGNPEQPLRPVEGARRQVGQGASGSETRRAQNRNAAAQHRRRQQQRLHDLARREAILKQRVSEVEIEVEVLRRGRAGLRLPERDPFTATILKMLSDVGNLRASLLHYTTESQLIVEDLRHLSNSLRGQQQQQQQVESREDEQRHH